MRRRRTRRTLRSYAVSASGNSAVFDSVDARTIRRFSVVVIFGIAVVAIIIFYVWQHVQIVKMGYLISRLQSEIQTLGNEKKLLEIEKDGLRSLARIEGIAKDSNQFLIPRDNAVIEFQIPVREENRAREEKRKENSLSRLFEMFGFSFGT